MATTASFVHHCLFFSLFLSLLSPSSAGNIVDFSYDASKKAPSLLQIQFNKNFKTQNMVFFTTSGTNPAPSCTVPVYLFLNPFEGTKWTNTNLPKLESMNISNIVITGTEISLEQSLSSLKSIHSSLKNLRPNWHIKLSISFHLSTLQTMHQRKNLNFDRIMQFLKKTDSFVLVETDITKTNLINIISTSIPNLDIPLILHIKGQRISPQIEISKFKLLMLKKGISGIFFENNDSIFHYSSHRFLLDSKSKFTKHDIYDPGPNPTYATPITVPSTNPTPPVVTILPTNPLMPPGTFPPLNPYPTPITVPATNPVPMPTTPVTNPVTTPATNPVTTYPYPYSQPGSSTTPTYLPPVSVPSTVPVPVPSTVPIGTVPVSSGQTWCVAKTGTSDSALQLALDYACGIGGADCTGIQPMGGCYNPNTIQAHASYAFNSYYQKNPSPTSCDFGGAGMLTNTNPSVGTCLFPSSSSALGNPTTTPPSTTPTPIYGTGTGISNGVGTGTSNGVGTGMTPGSITGTGLGPGSTGLTSGSNNSVFGTDNPTSTTSGSLSLSAGWISVLFVFSYILIRRIV